MSFSHDVKMELAEQIGAARHCQIAELAALLHFSGQYGRSENGNYTIGFQTENETVVKKGFTLLQKTFTIETDVEICESKMQELYHKFGDLNEPADNLLLKSACCRRAFIRGAFLCIGSISVPEKGYHLEFVCPNEAKAKQLQEIMQSFDIETKTILRKKYHVVYLKEGTAIVDLLNVMGAHSALMNLENMRIIKELRNSVNRRINCEAANMQKSINAATKQKEDILYLQKHYGLENLPENLRKMAEVRLECLEETSLKEMGEMLDPPVGKSGVNHRLRKLSEMAEKLRSGS